MEIFFMDLRSDHYCSRNLICNRYSVYVPTCIPLNYTGYSKSIMICGIELYMSKNMQTIIFASSLLSTVASLKLTIIRIWFYPFDIQADFMFCVVWCVDHKWNVIVFSIGFGVNNCDIILIETTVIVNHVKSI